MTTARPTPTVAGAAYELLLGDCIQTMRGLPANSVQCCVTSPPYLNLRSYLPADHPDKQFEIGAEQSVAEYVGKLVEVFREVRRLLRDDGVLFLNLGDSYNGSGGAGGDYGPGGLKEGQPKYAGSRMAGLKPKDLIGVPWEVAFALRADGWWLRQEIIWHKLAPMPESVQDRCTKAHEQVFLLAKSERYYFDHIAIREGETVYTRKGTPGGHKLTEQNGYKGIAGGTLNRDPDEPYGFARDITTVGRNKRSVWTLGPESYAGAHYATMPTKLVEPCILAGTSAHGCCSACGAPWERVTERGPGMPPVFAGKSLEGQEKYVDDVRKINSQRWRAWKEEHPDVDRGWAATCTCNAPVTECVVLDPFFGSGTVAAVSLKHGRRFVGIDLDSRNMDLARKRIEESQPLLLAVT